MRRFINSCELSHPMAKTEFSSTAKNSKTKTNKHTLSHSLDKMNVLLFKGINVLLKDPNYRLHCCGTVKKWLFYMESAGEIHLQIWKLDENGLYVLKGENVFIKNEGKSVLKICMSACVVYNKTEG